MNVLFCINDSKLPMPISREFNLELIPRVGEQVEITEFGVLQKLEVDRVTHEIVAINGKTTHVVKVFYEPNRD